MLSKRSLTIFASTFALVLIAGVAFAQVGTWAPDALEQDAAASEVQKVTTTTEAEKEDDKVDETTTTTEVDVKETTTTTEAIDNDPPDFAILHPENGQHFEKKEVVFEGKVEPGAKVHAGPFVADVNDDGRWRLVLVLEKGENHILISAVDAAGNESVEDITVYYEAPKPKPVDKEFTAHQKWGENDQAEDIFWGTGIAGDKVWIVSEYGTTTTYVNEKGNWEVMAKWHEVPNNTEIGIVIEASNGRKEFSFYKIGPVEHEFSAHQEYGSCDEAEPYDVFWGTAEPGSVIYVESDFGGGQKTVSESGQWEIAVYFNDAPYDDEFQIHVGVVGTELQKTFWFVRLSGEGEGEGEGDGEGEH